MRGRLGTLSQPICRTISGEYGIRFTLYNTDGTFSSAFQFGLLVNTWNHVAASYDASLNTCYVAVNGVATSTPN